MTETSTFILNIIDDDFYVDLVANHNLCCLCGTLYEYHYKQRHMFIPCNEHYRCKKCNMFYYQHTHNEKDCLFVPYKYIR